MSRVLLSLILILPPALAAAACPADPDAIKALDTEYQAAVEKNDAATMDRLLAEDFVLVIGKGTVYSKQDLLDSARDGKLKYARQSDTRQAVHLYGDTAVITALLSLKYTLDGKPFEYQLWFSDVYVCTPKGWRYSFGQAAQPLPST